MSLVMSQSTYKRQETQLTTLSKEQFTIYIKKALTLTVVRIFRGLILSISLEARKSLLTLKVTVTLKLAILQRTVILQTLLITSHPANYSRSTWISIRRTFNLLMIKEVATRYTRLNCHPMSINYLQKEEEIAFLRHIIVEMFKQVTQGAVVRK